MPRKGQRGRKSEAEEHVKSRCFRGAFFTLSRNTWKVDVSSEPPWTRPDLPARRFTWVSSGLDKPGARHESPGTVGMTVTSGGECPELQNAYLW